MCNLLDLVSKSLCQSSTGDIFEQKAQWMRMENQHLLAPVHLEGCRHVTTTVITVRIDQHGRMTAGAGAPAPKQELKLSLSANSETSYFCWSPPPQATRCTDHWALRGLWLAASFRFHLALSWHQLNHHWIKTVTLHDMMCSASRFWTLDIWTLWLRWLRLRW